MKLFLLSLALLTVLFTNAQTSICAKAGLNIPTIPTEGSSSTAYFCYRAGVSMAILSQKLLAIK